MDYYKNLFNLKLNLVDTIDLVDAIFSMESAWENLPLTSLPSAE